MDSSNDKGTKLGKADKNKLIKRGKLYEAAYELFITKGLNETVIDDIVKKAGVAKGTFYLYFKDKYDLLDRIIYKKSSAAIKEALKAAEEAKLKNGTGTLDALIFFIDYLVEYFKDNKKLLKLIYKNLSWGLYRKVLSDSENFLEVRGILEGVIEELKDEEDDIQTVEKTIYMIIELVGSVAYSAIVLEEPYTMDEMKPVLYRTIRKILTK